MERTVVQRQGISAIEFVADHLGQTPPCAFGAAPCGEPLAHRHGANF
jgi:hypothetical protein